MLMRQLWTQPSTTLHGRFFEVTEAPMVTSEQVWPSILVGGGGPKMMRLAGRVADIFFSRDRTRVTGPSRTPWRIPPWTVWWKRPHGP